jgi:hypothetical protein
MKPEVHIINKAKLEQLEHPTLHGAFGVHVTTGLIIYEKKGQKKGMIIDPGLVVDFDIYEKKLDEFGLSLNDITHLLITHLHQDHVQSLAKFPNLTQIFHYGKSSLLGTAEYGASVYETTIEIPEIEFFKVENSHTKKDTIYVINSSNQGKVAFSGDLVFCLSDVISKEKQQALDEDSSTIPGKKVKVLQEFFSNYLDIEGFYLGHDHRKISREQLQQCFKEWSVSE